MKESGGVYEGEEEVYIRERGTIMGEGKVKYDRHHAKRSISARTSTQQTAPQSKARQDVRENMAARFTTL